MGRPRHVAFVGALALIAASAIAAGSHVSVARADTPSGPYTVLANGTPATYNNVNGVSGWPDPNGPPAPAPTCSSSDPPAGGSCDRQTIHFQAGTAPTSDTFALQVMVTFTQKDPTLGNCLDLAIEDSTATTVYAHQNCVGSGGSVTAANIAPNADYTVEIDADANNGAIVMAQPFTATVTGTAAAVSGPTPTPVPSNPFTFTHEVSVDIQHGDGEPDLAISSDNQSLYSATPYGFSTTVSLMYKSQDGGVQWDNLHGSAVGQACPLPAALVLRPDCSRGGGDAEIQLSQPGSGGPQRVQFADLNGLDSISCAYSDDGGDTFHDLPAFVLSGNPVPGSACNEGGTVPPTCQTVPPPTNTCGTLGTDRQWIAVWPKADQPGGTTDHLYMTFDTGDQPPSGDAAIYSNDNGNTWTAACTTLTGPSCLGGANGVGSRPGPLVINPTLLNTVTGTANVVGGTYPTLYEFMGTSSNGTEVNISCDGGQTWSNVATSNGQVGSTTDDFVVGGIDQNGEVYTAYSVANGSSPWRVWFAHSTDSKQVGDCSQAIPGAGRWSSPTALTGPPSTSDGVGPTPVPGQTYAVMPWLTAGSAGRIDLVYYGTSAGVGLSPDSQAATWYLHMAQSLDGGATWTDEQASETPMHVKSICFSGIGCTAQTPPGGDRNLLDFFQVKLDSHGRAIIIYTDDNNTAACAPTCSPGIGLISSVQQASGPSLYGGSVPSITNGLSQSLDVRTAGANADVTDPTGDAVLANPGHNIQGTPVPAADITDLKVCTTHTTACPVANTAPNTLSFLFTVASLSGGPGSAVVTANGSTSANWLVTWRTNNDLWFAQAVTDPAGTLTCTYGRPQSIFNDGEPKAVEYIGNPEAMHLPATSCLANNTANTIEIDVPMDSISGLATASELYGLTGWTGNATAALPATVCQTAPGGTDCSGALGFFNNIDETAPLDVLLSGSQTVTPEVPSAPLLIGLGALAVLGGGYLRRWRRSSAL